MAKEQAAESKAMGVCEKLFHVLSFNSSFRPVRRLTFHENNSPTNHPPPPPTHNHQHSTNSGTMPKPAKLPEPKTNLQPPPAKPLPARTAAEKEQQLQKVASMAAPVAPPSKEKPVAVPAPAPPLATYKPRADTVPVPTPPKALGQPAPAVASLEEEKKKCINEKATQYIQNIRTRIRTGSFGRTPTTKSK